ncbi:MAG: 50S ribosomal protein L17 [Bacteroidales bacterium]|nr:50S ribosomal protein L17 [Bacteroidales bacterium]
MRHRKSFNHLSRTTSHRKAMLANMAASLILHKRIKTTTAKAKALRVFVEPLITKSKDDSTHSRRVVFSYLQDKEAVSELFREVSPKIIDRPGGYTRILKLGNRIGDNADMCIIELVDYNDNLLAAKEEVQTKSGRRRRRGGKKKTEGEQVPEAVTQVNENAVDEETEQDTAPSAEDTEKEEIVAETDEQVPEEGKAQTTDEEAESKAVEADVKESSEEVKPESEKHSGQNKEVVDEKEEISAEPKAEDTEAKDDNIEDTKEDKSEEKKKE